MNYNVPFSFVKTFFGANLNFLRCCPWSLVPVFRTDSRYSGLIQFSGGYIRGRADRAKGQDNLLL